MSQHPFKQGLGRSILLDMVAVRLRQPPSHIHMLLSWPVSIKALRNEWCHLQVEIYVSLAPDPVAAA